MRDLLYCTNCLQSITEPGTENVPADYFEDGEICPYCQNGTLGAPSTTVERFRLCYAEKIPKEDLDERVELMKKFSEKHSDKEEPKEILRILEGVRDGTLSYQKVGA